MRYLLDTGIMGDFLDRRRGVDEKVRQTGHIRSDKAAMAFWSREYEKGWEPRV